jgi:hypothetical protein
MGASRQRLSLSIPLSITTPLYCLFFYYWSCYYLSLYYFSPLWTFLNNSSVYCSPVNYSSLNYSSCTAWKRTVDTEHGHAARTCRKDMRHRHAALTCSRNMHHGHEPLTYSMHMQHGHAAWACKSDMKHGHAAWTWSTEIQNEKVAQKCGMNKQHGKQQYTAGICRRDMYVYCLHLTQESCFSPCPWIWALKQGFECGAAKDEFRLFLSRSFLFALPRSLFASRLQEHKRRKTQAPTSPREMRYC